MTGIIIYLHLHTSPSLFVDASKETTRSDSPQSGDLSTVHVAIISSVGAVVCVLIISLLIACLIKLRSHSQQAAQQR